MWKLIYGVWWTVIPSSLMTMGQNLFSHNTVCFFTSSTRGPETERSTQSLKDLERTQLELPKMFHVNSHFTWKLWSDFNKDGRSYWKQYISSNWRMMSDKIWVSIEKFAIGNFALLLDNKKQHPFFFLSSRKVFQYRKLIKLSIMDDINFRILYAKTRSDARSFGKKKCVQTEKCGVNLFFFTNF